MILIMDTVVFDKYSIKTGVFEEASGSDIRYNYEQF